jgi:hypothetical protein
MNHRLALVVTNSDYERLDVPESHALPHEAKALAEVLQEPDIGGYAVNMSFNQPLSSVISMITRIFDECEEDTVLLLYLGCIVLEDNEGKVYFATTDTQHSDYYASALSLGFLNDMSHRCRSRQQVFILNCSPMEVKSDEAADIKKSLGAEYVGDGVTILAHFSRYKSQIIEKEDMIDSNSLFAQYLVEGLQTGEADIDGDGDILTEELFQYINKRFQLDTPDLERPTLFLPTGVSSKTVIAHSRRQTNEEQEKRPLAEEKSEAEPEAIRYEIAIRALADRPSDIDLLRFSDYADALADFIKNENTNKPLTIAIDAPWGMGKTTLMRMIKKRLGQQEVKTKKRDFCPTVWFNAWKYDQEESLWAALVLEILAEARKRLSIWERCWFWLSLNWKRFDRGRLMRRMVKSLACILGLCLLGAIALVIAALLGLVTKVPALQITKAVGVLGVLTALYTFGKEVHNRIKASFDLSISEYVHAPNYEERIGFLVEFEKDFKRVINVITDEGKWPLVVFIDDLDRCAPPKPVEIIEALNILLDAEHCVFVIGMDAETVAGSIEAKYEALKKYLGNASDPGGLTLGQRFLEKIVQINFRIPKAESTTVASFVEANLGQLVYDQLEAEPKATEKELEKAIAEAEKLIKAEQRDGRSLDDAAQAVQASKPSIPKDIIGKAQKEVFAKSFDDSEEVRKAIDNVIHYLGLNPRKLKRFINHFRLQTLIASRRGLLETKAIELDLLAKWVVIATRWPVLVQGMIAEESFVKSLKEEYQIQDEIPELEKKSISTRDDYELRIEKSRLDTLVADSRIRKLLSAGDLFQLLIQMSDADIKNLPRYLYLAQTTTS